MINEKTEICKSPTTRLTKNNNTSQNSVRQNDSATTIAIEKNIDKKTNDYTFFKKNFALEYMQNNIDKQLSLFSQDLGDKGAKCFVCVTRDEMYNMCTTQKSPHYYENIEAGFPVKFHIDIDKKIAGTNRAVLDHTFNTLVEEAICLFNNEFKKHNINNPEIIVLKSDHVTTDEGITKISAHIIYKNVIFNDINEMKVFILKMKSGSQLLENNIIDKNIYRVGCFRLLYCSKKGKFNKLRCYRDFNCAFVDEKTHFFDSLVTHIIGDNNHIIKVDYQVDAKVKTYKIRQIMKERAPIDGIFFYVFSESELADLTLFADKLDSKFIDNYNYWILMTYSFIDLYNHVDKKYQKPIYKIWDDICKKGKNYNKSNNKKYFFSLQLDYINANFILSITDAPFRFKKVIKYEHIKPKFDGYDVDRLSCRFIDDDMYKKVDLYDIIALKSPPGTGKTTFLNKVFDIKIEDDQATNNFEHPIISITSRKNLAEKHAKDLGIFNYSSTNQYLFDVNKIAVTVNSLVRISESNFKDCYLVLDETSKVLEYLKCDILSGIRYYIYNIFCNIIVSAKKIILLDADLTEGDLDMIVNLRKLSNKGSSYYLAVNEFKSKTGINAHFYNNARTVANMLIDDFGKNVPFMCSFDSLTKMKELFNEIKKTAVSMNVANKIDDLIKTYSSETEDILDPNDFKDDLSLLYSPKLLFGQDFNSKKPKRIYSFAFKKILTPYEINQQSQRERNSLENHLFINPSIGQLKYMSRDELRSDIQNRVDKYNDVIKEIKEIAGVDGISGTTKNKDYVKVFSDMYINTTFINDTTKVDMEYYLKNIMIDMGYTIVDKKDKIAVNKFGFEQDKKPDDMGVDIFEQLGIDGNIDPKKKETILNRMEIMKIKVNQLDDFNKKIIKSDTKFSDYLNLLRFMKSNFNKNILAKDDRDMAEFACENVYIKLREYKKVTDVLKIKDGLRFDYDKDSKKFNSKITDKYILDNFANTCDIFRLTSTKFCKFDDAGGYERLYYMAISMCKQLFGNEIVISTQFSKRVNGNSIKIPMYKFNDMYMKQLSAYLL